MSNKAIVSFGTGKHKELLDIAFPTFKAFADLHGWDLYCCDEIGKSRPAPWYKVNSLLELLQDYDEALFLGADTVIVDGREDLTVPPGYWQALVEHHTGDGCVPNTDVWFCRKSMIATLRQVWSMDKWLMHGWWEQAALMELMGYQVWQPARVLLSGTELYRMTYFLDHAWNVHKWDNPQPEHPRIQHATMYPDRAGIMREWAREAQEWMN